METFNPDLESVFQKFKKGDKKAMGQLYRAYYTEYVYFARSKVKLIEDAQDIVSESFAKLFSKTNDFDSLDKLKGFLYTVTHNACLDYIKHNRIREKHEPVLISLLQNLGMESLDKVKAEVLGEIYRQVQKLPGKCREIFELYYKEGLTTKEIATKLVLKEQTVLNQKKKALDILRACGNIKESDLLLILMLYPVIYQYISNGFA